jgi:hypothetical protein
MKSPIPHKDHLGKCQALHALVPELLLFSHCLEERFHLHSCTPGLLRLPTCVHLTAVWENQASILLWFT